MPEEQRPETRICDNCDAVIAKSEKKCPACKDDVEENDELVSGFEKAQKLIAKRLSRTTPETQSTPEIGKKKSIFRRLGKKNA